MPSMSTSRAPRSVPSPQLDHAHEHENDDHDDHDQLSNDDDDDDDDDDTHADTFEIEEDSHPFLPESLESLTPFTIPTYSQCPWTETIERLDVDRWIANRFEEGTWNKHTTRIPKHDHRDLTDEPSSTKKGPPKRLLSVIEYRCTWSGNPRIRDTIPRKTLAKRVRKPSTKVGCKAKFFIKETIGNESRQVVYHWQHTGHDPTSLTQTLRVRPSQLPPSLRAIRPITRKSQNTPTPQDDQTVESPGPSVPLTPGHVGRLNPDVQLSDYHLSVSPLRGLVDGPRALSLGFRSPPRRGPLPPPSSKRRRRVDGSADEDDFTVDDFNPVPLYEQLDDTSIPNGREVSMRTNRLESRIEVGINHDEQEEFVPMEEVGTPMDTTPFLPTFTPVRRSGGGGGSRGYQQLGGGSMQGPSFNPFLSQSGSSQATTTTFTRPFLVPKHVPTPSNPPTTSTNSTPPSFLETQDTLSLLRTIRQSHESSGKTLELLTHRLIQEGSGLDDRRLKDVMRRAAGSALGYGDVMREWAMEEGV